jgi:hypothetical protein
VFTVRSEMRTTSFRKVGSPRSGGLDMATEPTKRKRSVMR